MAKDPTFPMYAQDFIVGSLMLTNEERGMYITCLCFQWNNADRIPKKRLGFLVGSDWDTWSDELKEKFLDHGEYIVNERLLAEREKREAFKRKQKSNGKKGGRPKKDTKKQKPSQTQKNPLESENEDESENEYPDENTGGLGEEDKPTFEEFWDAYDKKIGKKDKLKKKWQKLPQATRQKIMDYIPGYIEAQPDKKYRKNPETFLNNESWEDELIPTENEQITTKKPQREITRLAERILSGDPS